jgi:hypothetical protein
LLLLTGVAGVVGGLAALIKPERAPTAHAPFATVPVAAPRLAA